MPEKRDIRAAEPALWTETRWSKLRLRTSFKHLKKSRCLRLLSQYILSSKQSCGSRITLNSGRASIVNFAFGNFLLKSLARAIAWRISPKAPARTHKTFDGTAAFVLCIFEHLSLYVSTNYMYQKRMDFLYSWGG